MTWAIDLADGPAAPTITLLLEQGQRVLFLPGLAVNRVAGAYRKDTPSPARRLTNRIESHAARTAAWGYDEHVAHRRKLRSTSASGCPRIADRLTACLGDARLGKCDG